MFGHATVYRSAITPVVCALKCISCSEIGPGSGLGLCQWARRSFNDQTTSRQSTFLTISAWPFMSRITDNRINKIPLLHFCRAINDFMLSETWSKSLAKKTLPSRVLFGVRIDPDMMAMAGERFFTRVLPRTKDDMVLGVEKLRRKKIKSHMKTARFAVHCECIDRQQKLLIVFEKSWNLRSALFSKKLWRKKTGFYWGYYVNNRLPQNLNLKHGLFHAQLPLSGQVGTLMSWKPQDV